MEYFLKTGKAHRETILQINKSQILLCEENALTLTF